MGEEKKIVDRKQDFFVHHRIVSAVKTVQFISDRTSYIVLRGCWCDIGFNVHAQSEEKSDSSKDNFKRNKAGFRSFF
jgi:hypothetical protein